MKFATKSIHIGQDHEPITGSVIPPLFLTSTYIVDYPGVTKGYDYTRHGNPNFVNLEKTLSAIENAKYATVFSSGMAAIASIAASLSQGDRVIALREVYGGTYRLFADVFQKLGVSFELIENLDHVEKALKPPTKVLLFETPTNPLLEIIDIAKMANLAKKHHVLVVVDNTFASPFFQHPLALGADVVWHSTTKYIGGHSDLIGGALVTNSEELKKQFDLLRLSLGFNPSPFDVWLLSRGVKTLSLRMKQHEQNGMALAQFLEKHPKVKKVHYPGLSHHPGHDIAKRQMQGYSGMFSVEFDLSLEETKKLISSFELFALGVSLGGVESLVNHSVSMSHANVPEAERKKMGITDGLVRFSAGIEDTDDLLEDLSQALDSIN